MTRLIALLFIIMLGGCGSGDPCEGVDTSQAPDRSTVNGNYITFYWGTCSKTYQVK